MLHKKSFVFIINVIIFSSLSLFAQEKNIDVGNTQNSDETAPQAFSVADIVSQSEKTMQSITRIKKNIANNTDLIKIKSEYTKLHKLIERYKKETEKENFEKLLINKLLDLGSRVEAFSIKITLIQSVIKSSIDNLNSGLITLKREKAIWKETYKSRYKQKIPAPLIERINSSLKYIREVQKVVHKELNNLLDLQSAVSDDDFYVKEQLLLIDNAKKNIQKRIYQINQPPLWEISIDSSLYSEILNTLRHKKNSFIYYFDNYTISVEIHIFIFLFLLIISFLLYFKINKEKIDGVGAGTNFAKVLIRYPVSTTLLITCLITPIIHPHAPTVLRQLNRLILFLPVIRLVPLLFLRDLKNVIMGFLILFMLHTLANLLINDPTMQRVIITGLIVISLFGLIFLNRTKLITSKLTNHSRWVSIIRIAFYLGIFLVIVSLVAIVFGAVNFAKLVFGAELNSAYFAVVLLTGKIILINFGEALIDSKMMIFAKSIKNNKELIIKRYNSVVHFVFIITWLMGTLSFFGIYEWIINIIIIIFTASASIGNINISLGSILAFILAVYITFKISNLVRTVLNDDILPHVSLPEGVHSTILTMTHYVILMIGFLFAVSAAGMNWNNLAIIIGSLGVGIGFGLQNLVNNFVSGLILIFERPVSIGDVVEVGNLMGTVKRIGIRSSTIRTFTESEVIVPNGLLISQELVNWTLSDRQRRLDIPIGVAYGTDPLKVMTILQEVAEANPRVKDYPKPFITFEGFGDSSLDFLLRIWAADFAEGLKIKTEVMMDVYKRFNEENIEIPFPQRDIHIIPQEKGKKETSDKKNDSLENENITNEIESSGLDNASG